MKTAMEAKTLLRDRLISLKREIRRDFNLQVQAQARKLQERIRRIALRNQLRLDPRRTVRPQHQLPVRPTQSLDLQPSTLQEYEAIQHLVKALKPVKVRLTPQLLRQEAYSRLLH